jgi:hypothetical protein
MGMGFSWLLLAIGIGAQPTEFQLDTDTPDALCPELSMTRDAIKQRLGQLEVEGGGLWRGRYGTVHDPAGRRGDYVRLVIVDPTGKEQVVRELPLQGESCATLAQAIALVIDGFFRDFGQSPLPEGVATDSGGERSKSGPSPTASAPTTTTTIPNSQAPRAPELPLQLPPEQGCRAGFILGGGYDSVTASAAPVLGLSVAATPRWRVDLKSLFPTARVSESYGKARAYLYPLQLRLSLSYTMPLSRGLLWFIGPESLLSLERGSISGVSSGRSGWRASIGIGGRTGIAFWVLPELAVATNLSADAMLHQSRRFLLVDEPILKVPGVRMAGTLELWGTIFP